MLIKNIRNTDVEYWADKISMNEVYINTLFESWKPLASNCSSDSQYISDSMIRCSVAASIKLNFEIDGADITAAKRTYTKEIIVCVNNSFILNDFIIILIKI